MSTDKDDLEGSHTLEASEASLFHDEGNLEDLVNEESKKKKKKKKKKKSDKKGDEKADLDAEGEGGDGGDDGDGSDEKNKLKKSKSKKLKKKKSSKKLDKKKKSKRDLGDSDEISPRDDLPKRETPRMDSGISGISMDFSEDSDEDDGGRKSSRPRGRRRGSMESEVSADSTDDEPIIGRKVGRSQSAEDGPLEAMTMSEAVALGLDPSSPAVMKAIQAGSASASVPARSTSEPLDGMAQAANGDEKERKAPARSTSTPLRDIARGMSSRRGLFGRGTSTRSMDSTGSGGSRRQKFSRGVLSAFSTRSMATTDTADEELRAERKKEKEMSAIEKREKRLMKKELKSLQNYRKRLLEKKIKEEGGPRWNFILAVVTVVTAGELGMDLGTTVLSLASIMSSFACCGEEVGVSPWLLGTTIPYFVLVSIEFVLLGFSIKQARANTAKDKLRFKKIDELDEDEEWFSDEEDNEDIDEVTGCQKDLGHVIHWVVLANPFLGCLIAWFLLYEVASKTEALVIVGLEAGAVFLMFVGCYLKRDKFTFNSLLLHGLPLIPLGAVSFMVWYYLREGGVCFKNNTFAFDGCELCSARDPKPAVSGVCWNGAQPYQGTFCGDTVETRFCYFSYQRDE